jgi:hypothetical protein
MNSEGLIADLYLFRFIFAIHVLPFAKTPHYPESLSRNNVTGGCTRYSFQSHFEFWRGKAVSHGGNLYKALRTQYVDVTQIRHENYCEELRRREADSNTRK